MGWINMKFFRKNNEPFQTESTNTIVPPGSIWRLDEVRFVGIQNGVEVDEYQFVRVPEKDLQFSVTFTKEEFCGRFEEIDVFDLVKPENDNFHQFPF